MLMKHYYRNKEQLVDAVGGLLPFLNKDLPLTMTIRQVRSGDYSVYFVIGSSLDDIVDPLVLRYFKMQRAT